VTIMVSHPQEVRNGTKTPVPCREASPRSREQKVTIETLAKSTSASAASAGSCAPSSRPATFAERHDDRVGGVVVWRVDLPG